MGERCHERSLQELGAASCARGQFPPRSGSHMVPSQAQDLWHKHGALCPTASRQPALLVCSAPWQVWAAATHLSPWRKYFLARNLLRLIERALREELRTSVREEGTFRNTEVMPRDGAAPSEGGKANGRLCPSRECCRFRSTSEMLVYQCMQYEELIG